MSKAQAYALIRRGDLPAIKIGGRGVYRVARVDLEAHIEAAFRRDLKVDPGAPVRRGGRDGSV